MTEEPSKKVQVSVL